MEIQTEQKELIAETSGLCAVPMDGSPFGVGEDLYSFEVLE